MLKSKYHFLMSVDKERIIHDRDRRNEKQKKENTRLEQRLQELHGNILLKNPPPQKKQTNLFCNLVL